jgi:SAM-dependent methyltransferase
MKTSIKLKPNLNATLKKGVYYIIDEHQKIKKYKPWLGDIFCFVYDWSMAKNVFPKKFGGDLDRHYDILKKQMQDVHNRRILELGTGTGNAVYFLNTDNHYIGIDTSAGLLRRTGQRFQEFGFQNAAGYLASADDLPFAEDQFEVLICHLSLQFFPDIHKVLPEIQRVMQPGASIYFSTPVPERAGSKSKIHGTLFTEAQYKTIFNEHNMNFESLPDRNGNLLYFKASI